MAEIKTSAIVSKSFDEQLQQLCDFGILGESETLKRRQRDRAAADALATSYLAFLECPEDVKTWGVNNKVPAFAEMTWQAGFVAGWRMAIANAAKHQDEREG